MIFGKIAQALNIGKHRDTRLATYHLAIDNIALGQIHFARQFSQAIAAKIRYRGNTVLKVGSDQFCTEQIQRTSIQ